MLQVQLHLFDLGDRTLPEHDYPNSCPNLNWTLRYQRVPWGLGNHSLLWFNIVMWSIIYTISYIIDYSCFEKKLLTELYSKYL